MIDRLISVFEAFLRWSGDVAAANRLGHRFRGRAAEADAIRLGLGRVVMRAASGPDGRA